MASCERTHSKVKILNNYCLLLEDLVQLQISCERDIADTIKLETLVDDFKLKSQRRIKQ